MPLNKDTTVEPEVEEDIFLPSTIENIDSALTDYIHNLNIFATTNKGWAKVPVVWTSAERNFQIKDNKDLRDSSGALIKPVITIERTAINKDLTRKGKISAAVPNATDVKGGVVTIARQINQEKSSNFANADAKRLYKQKTFKTNDKSKTVYETITIPVPVNVELSYSLTLYAEYQQQINEMITPFITRPGGINLVMIEKNRHRYEAFIQANFDSSNNLSSLASEERKFETKVEIKVIGYLIGDGPNQEQPKIVKRQNAVEVKIPRERVIVGDVNEFIKNGFYRE